MSDTNITMTVVEIMGHPDKPVSARCILSGCQDMTTNAAPQVRGSTVEMPASTSPAAAAPHPVVAEMEAAEAFVQDYVERGKYDAAAENSLSWGYLWHGWALRDAFHAGAKYARGATETKGAAIDGIERGWLEYSAGRMDGAEFANLVATILQFAAADRTDDKGGGAGAK